MADITTEVENIADAIKSSEEMAASHTGAAHRILQVVMMLTVTLMVILFVVFLFPAMMPDRPGVKLQIPDAALYVFLAIYVLTFSVLMAIYRLHVGEASRLQHYKIGFMRIRIAGSNPSAGYQSEVRTALTQGAFDFILGTAKKGKIESPVPGHPGSDFATAIVNQVLERFDVAKKERKARSRTSASEKGDV
jgi:hypothetical protein